MIIFFAGQPMAYYTCIYPILIMYCLHIMHNNMGYKYLCTNIGPREFKFAEIFAGQTWDDSLNSIHFMQRSQWQTTNSGTSTEHGRASQQNYAAHATPARETELNSEKISVSGWSLRRLWSFGRSGDRWAWQSNGTTPQTHVSHLRWFCWPHSVINNRNY